ncbi:uncharacterized protein LOC142985112 [Anticarsia gemmatalis]|uniref:uncharacterized protein LOC142985112 n=1 Tax=Anticarsia gemmatalis TaxID=129554 RepID=UPI003F759F9B
MTSRLHLLLAAACALALIQLASGELNCTTESWGATSGSNSFSWSFPVIGVPVITLGVPKDPNCPLPVGISVVACDYDASPTVKIFADRRLVTINRKGNVYYPGTITINTIC